MTDDHSTPRHRIQFSLRTFLLLMLLMCALLAWWLDRSRLVEEHSSEVKKLHERLDEAYWAIDELNKLYKGEPEPITTRLEFARNLCLQPQRLLDEHHLTPDALYAVETQTILRMNRVLKDAKAVKGIDVTFLINLFETEIEKWGDITEQIFGHSE